MKTKIKKQIFRALESYELIQSVFNSGNNGKMHMCIGNMIVQSYPPMSIENEDEINKNKMNSK